MIDESAKEKIIPLIKYEIMKEVMELKFPWEDVDACMDDEVEPPIDGLTVCPICGNKINWIRFRSSDWSWQHLCGREGPLAVCEKCHKQVYFRCEMMN